MRHIALKFWRKSSILCSNTGASQYGSLLLCHLRNDRSCQMFPDRHQNRSFSVVASETAGKPHVSLGLNSGGHSDHLGLQVTRGICSMGKAHRSVLKVLPLSHLTACSYAKGKSKGKDKSKGHGSSSRLMKLSQDDLHSVMDVEKFYNQLNGQIEHLKNEFVQHLGLRTSLAAFDGLVIDTNDGKFPLIQLGQVAQKSQQSIVINMSASPQYIPDVKTALMTSMGLNPQQDGTTLFVNIPKVTKEHRESLAKGAKNAAEKVKVKLRDVQNKHLHNLKKSKDSHSEDLIFSTQSYIQDEVKKYIEQVDSLTLAKRKELLGGK